MTAVLSKALEQFDPDWMSKGLEESFVRSVRGTLYAVVVRGDAVLAVYRVSTKRLHVVKLTDWPHSLMGSQGEAKGSNVNDMLS